MRKKYRAAPDTTPPMGQIIESEDFADRVSKYYYGDYLDGMEEYLSNHIGPSKAHSIVKSATFPRLDLLKKLKYIYKDKKFANDQELRHSSVRITVKMIGKQTGMKYLLLLQRKQQTGKSVMWAGIGAGVGTMVGFVIKGSKS